MPFGAADIENLWLNPAARQNFYASDPNGMGKNCFLASVRNVTVTYLSCHSAGQLFVPFTYLGMTDVTNTLVRFSAGTHLCPDMTHLFRQEMNLRTIVVDLQGCLDNMRHLDRDGRPATVERHVRNIVQIITGFEKLSCKLDGLDSLTLRISASQTWIIDVVELSLQRSRRDFSSMMNRRIRWVVKPAFVSPRLPLSQFRKTVSKGPGKKSNVFRVCERLLLSNIAEHC